jgi:hypothetical protein
MPVSLLPHEAAYQVRVPELLKPRICTHAPCLGSVTFQAYPSFWPGLSNTAHSFSLVPPHVSRIPALADPPAERAAVLDLGEADSRLRVMTIGEAAEQRDELLPGVELWDRVVLTKEGRRVAVILAWDWWTPQRHRQASLEGAYWANGHTGEFNLGGYACDRMRFLEPRDARIKFPDDEVHDEDNRRSSTTEQRLGAVTYVPVPTDLRTAAIDVTWGPRRPSSRCRTRSGGRSSSW